MRFFKTLGALQFGMGAVLALTDDQLKFRHGLFSKTGESISLDDQEFSVVNSEKLIHLKAGEVFGTDESNLSKAFIEKLEPIGESFELEATLGDDVPTPLFPATNRNKNKNKNKR